MTRAVEHCCIQLSKLLLCDRAGFSTARFVTTTGFGGGSMYVDGLTAKDAAVQLGGG